MGIPRYTRDDGRAVALLDKKGLRKSMSIEKVVIIIPTYNEAVVIQQTISEIFQATKSIQQIDLHILIFDSHSTDGTPNIIKQLQQQNNHLHLQEEQTKSGLGSAYLQAMHYALQTMAADIIVEFDADLSHQPKYLVPMLEKIKHYDVVMGSRYIKDGSIPADWGSHRKFLSILGNFTARLALTLKYKDFTSGFRATRRAILSKVLPNQFISSQYAYKIELLWRLHQHKARILEYPIAFIDRQKGQSKLPANSIHDALRVLFILRFHKFIRYFKMCLVGLTGMSIQYLLYNLLRETMSPFHAIQIAASGAVINNFLLNNRFTFKKPIKPTRLQQFKSFSLFMGYSAVMVSFHGYWLEAGIQYFGAGYLKENLIIFTGIVMSSIFNYLIYSRLIWKMKPVQLSS